MDTCKCFICSYHFCPKIYDILQYQWIRKKLGKVKNSLIANHRVIWINIIRKTGPYVRVKQPSTAHLFHCIVDLECLHANCVYHSMGGSLVWFVCSNCKRAINVSITGTEMDKYLPNPPTYQTNPVPSPFYKTNITTILRNTYLGVTKYMTRRNFLFLVRFCF